MAISFKLRCWWLWGLSSLKSERKEIDARRDTAELRFRLLLGPDDFWMVGDGGLLDERLLACLAVCWISRCFSSWYNENVVPIGIERCFRIRSSLLIRCGLIVDMDTVPRNDWRFASNAFSVWWSKDLCFGECLCIRAMILLFNDLSLFPLVVFPVKWTSRLRENIFSLGEKGFSWSCCLLCKSLIERLLRIDIHPSICSSRINSDAWPCRSKGTMFTFVTSISRRSLFSRFIIRLWRWT